MAVIKHISVKGSNGGDALNYVLYKHNEKTGELIVDGRGNPVMRDEYYLDGINCEPYSFAAECKELNDLYGKNQLPGDIKAHHFIISYDPKDGIEHGLTGSKAQQLSMEWAERCLPGFQILVCTHMDGSNESGNIHTHIMMNSVRKYDTKLDDFGERTIDHLAGYKLNLTNNHLQFMKQELMDLCGREGLYQIDLLSPAKDRITDKEYRAQKNGQDHLDRQYAKDNDKSERTVFQTQKQYLRDAVLDVAERATSFDEFCEIMNTEYNITVKETRGRISYLHPDREKYISGGALGTSYEKESVIQVIKGERTEKIFGKNEINNTVLFSTDTLENCKKIFEMHSDNRLVVQLQGNAKSQLSALYVNKVTLTYVKMMAETILFIQQNGFNSERELSNALTVITNKGNRIENEMLKEKTILSNTNKDIHFLGQYLTHKSIYAEFIKVSNKSIYMKKYKKEIESYQEAVRFLRQTYEKTEFPSLRELHEKKSDTQKRINDLQIQKKTLQKEEKALRIATHNIRNYLRESKEINKGHHVKRTHSEAYNLNSKDR